MLIVREKWHRTRNKKGRLFNKKPAIICDDNLFYTISAKACCCTRGTRPATAWLSRPYW